MARSVLEIVYRLVKQGGGDRETLAGIKNVQKGIKELAVVGGAVVAVGYGIKKAFDMAREGAEIEMMQGRLSNLAGTVGTTSDALMNDLRVATRGLYSDSELAASAVDFLGLGLAKTHDEAVRLSAVAAALNMNMNQLTLTLTNKTTMRFDALGVSVDGFSEKVKALEETGMSADAAFKEAFLQQAEAQIEKVGHAADTTYGSFMKLDASTKNIKDNFKMFMAEALGPLVDKMADNSSKYTEFHTILKRLNPELEKQFRWTQTLNDEMINTVAAYQRAEQYGAAWERALESQGSTAISTAGSLEEVARSTEEISAANQDLMGLIGQMQSENEKYTESLDELNLKFDDAKYVQDLYKQSKDELLASARSGTITWEEYSAQVASLSSDYQDGTFAAQEQAVAVEALATQHEEASRRIAFSLLQQKAAADGLTDAEFQGLLSIGKMWGMIDEKTAESAILMDQQMGQIAAAIEEPLGDTIDLNQSMYHLMQKSGSIVDFTVNIMTKGGLPSLKNLMGGAGSPNDIYAGEFASGGQWDGGLAFVGEKGMEMITPSGYIIPHEKTKELMAMGIVPSVGYAVGYEGGAYIPPGVTVRPQKKRPSSVPSSVVSQEINQASNSATSSEVVPLMQSTEEAVQTSAQVQKQASMDAYRTQSIIQSGNAETVSVLKDVKDLLERQERTMVRATIAAVQQAAP